MRNVAIFRTKLFQNTHNLGKNHEFMTKHEHLFLIHDAVNITMMRSDHSKM